MLETPNLQSTYTELVECGWKFFPCSPVEFGMTPQGLIVFTVGGAPSRVSDGNGGIRSETEGNRARNNVPEIRFEW